MIYNVSEALDLIFEIYNFSIFIDFSARKIKYYLKQNVWARKNVENNRCFFHKNIELQNEIIGDKIIFSGVFNYINCR